MAAERQPNTFDQAAVAKALKTESSKLADPAFGDGWHFQVNGNKDPLSLDTFPDSGVSRITTKGARIELFGGSLPTVEEEGVVFLHKDDKREHSSVTLHPDGGLTLGYMIDAGPVKVSDLPDGEDTGQMIAEHEAAEKSADDKPSEPELPSKPTAKPGPSVTMIGRADTVTKTAQEQAEPKKPQRAAGAFPDERPMADKTQSPEPALSTNGHVEPAAQQEQPLARVIKLRAQDEHDESTQQVQAEAEPEKTAEGEPERVRLIGRLGRNPTIRETAGGKLVAKFPLAIHLEDDTTRWHDVLAFGDRAQALQKRVEAGELVKGHEVEVVGYPHAREYTGRDGTPKTAQEIYLAAVKRR
ncbi:single-stranded DNA-binding protein [Streptomyces olivoreticuli]